MKFLLTAINAKYIHSNLAVHTLKAYAADKFKNPEFWPESRRKPVIEIAEYTINQTMEKILMDIYRKNPDVVFFSCYIWNRQETEKLIIDLGKIKPDLDIWIGGPEVTFDSAKILESLQNVKGVVRGEGEEIFFDIIKTYREEDIVGSTGKRTGFDEEMMNIRGVDFRDSSNEIIIMPEHRIMDLSDVPFPYDTLDEFENRIIYYESSRGCPFRCSYCLSSVEKTLRFRNIDLVKKELQYFIDKKIPQVKFIDRTFNCDREHAEKIWKFIGEHDNGITNFHFEIAADLITDEQLEFLKSLRPGQVQFEIGVQSTNKNTLNEINRPMDFARLSEVVSSIKKFNNIHMHLDLIAGLPFEDITSFRQSFNDVFSLRPEQLQLGFLKVLKGSPMEKKCWEYGLKYTQQPPYEVLETKWISYDDLIQLKMIEEMVEVYYNSGQFMNTIEFLLEKNDDAFGMFESLAHWYDENGFMMLNLSRNQRYENLLKFAEEYIGESEIHEIIKSNLMQALIRDYYSRENAKNRPSFLGEYTIEKSFAKEFYSVEAREHKYLSSEKCMVDDPRILRNLTHLEMLDGKYCIFDYTRRDPMNNNAKIIELEI